MIPTPQEKADLYRLTLAQIMAAIEDETDPIALMAGVVCVLKTTLPHVSWAGFYRTNPHQQEELVIGPYQGSLAAPRIAFGQGVCGTCAEVGLPVIIPDLRDDRESESCHSRAVSEIALPVFDQHGHLCAVLDLDSLDLDAFQDEDCEGLEAILEAIRLKL